jgi:hypothetical protein
MSTPEVLVHLIFRNDGAVTHITALPGAATPQQWFDHLSLNAASAYQPLSGGRGVFRLTPQDLGRLSVPFESNHHALS